MHRTIIIMSHNRPIQYATQEALAALRAAGALLLTQSGTTDVTLARNLALSGVCDRLRAANRRSTERDTVLMVDDDMVFTLDDAQRLVDYARSTGMPASAAYATHMSTLAATRLKTDPSAVQLWVTGLGFLAIPAAKLLELEQRSEVFTTMQETRRGFTWSIADGGNYWSEDFTLCRRLGGVHLLPIPVGHVKPWPLYPDDETLECIREGRRLPGELPTGGELPFAGPCSSTAFATLAAFHDAPNMVGKN
jgi:hypothetical protein